MGAGDVVGLVLGCTLLFMGPVALLSVWTRHKQKMAEITRSDSVKQADAGQIARLHDEIAQLRETTTKYDISVEQALAGLQNRLETLERQGRSGYSTGAVDPSEQHVPSVQGLGRST